MQISKLEQKSLNLTKVNLMIKRMYPSLSHSLCQEQLPATGVPMRKNHSDLMQDKFNDYVKSRTLQNWKFWIVSFS